MRIRMNTLHAPKWNGDILCPEIQGDTDIFRDDHGVPYIMADYPQDAWFALGFCQGLDRAFQIEISNRKANGTLSEVFGEATLAADKLARVIGFRRLAQEYLLVMDSKEREILDAFTLGINLGAEKATSNKPDDFTQLGIEFSSLTPVDIIAYHLLLTFSLSHWSSKITRLKLLLEGKQDIISMLDPGFASWNYLTYPIGQKAGKGLDYLRDDIFSAEKVINKKGISNNWAITSKKTKNGRPIVANDPHLGAEIPAPWYPANMECKDFRISGACLAGSPLFLTGFNYHVAWGITAGFIDNIDLFLEEVSTDGSAVKRGNKYRPCKKFIEEIKVKNKAPHSLVIQVTDRGPLLSSLDMDQIPPISFCASWMKPKGIQGFFNVPFARNVDEFTNCFAAWPLFSLNLVYADDQNNSAWCLAGEIPLRKKTHGLLPMPGWDPAFDWENEPIPFSQNPKCKNPDSDFIATANNKPVSENGNPYIGRDFIDGYRHARIVELIENSKGKIELDDCKNYQLDQRSTVWRDIRKSIISDPCKSVAALEAQKKLVEWDGFVSANSAEATVFEYFVAEFSKLVVKQVTGDLPKWSETPLLVGTVISLFGPSWISQLVLLLNKETQIPNQGNIEDLIERALDQTWQLLEKQYGPFSPKWSWGSVRPLELKHILAPIDPNASRNPILDKYNLPPHSYGGDEQCVSVAAGAVDDPTVRPNFIPNLRMVVEIGDWENNFFSLAGGISGDPDTAYYDDLYELWVKGKGISLKTNSDNQQFITRLHPTSKGKLEGAI